MAAEAQVEELSPPSPRVVAAPAAVTPEKRGALMDGEGQEERPEPKRRRVPVAALENVPRAVAVAAASATASEESDAGEPAGGCDGGSPFSFHARSFSGVETTPKFGSFNPASAEFAVFRLTPPLEPAEGVGSPAAGVSDVEQEEKGRDGNSH